MHGPVLERLADLTPVLFIAADTHGTVVAARGAWPAILGWQPGEVVGMKRAFLMHPDDVDAIVAVRAQARAHRTSIEHFQCRMRHKDGSYRWIEWRAPPPDEDDIAMGIGVDITARKAQEQALQTAQEQLRSVLETVPGYISRLTPEGVIEYVNRTYPAVTREQVIGTHLLNWVPPEHRSIMEEAFARVRDGEEVVEITLQAS